MNTTITLLHGAAGTARGRALVAFAGLLLAGTIVATMPALAAAGDGGGVTATWRPEASERLIKLPTHYMKRALDQDFAGSELAAAMTDIDQQLKDKTQTLTDLQAAIGQAEGEVRTELKHQFLAEKREFIMLNGQRQDLKRKQLRTRIRVYETLVGKIDRAGASMTPAKEQFLENHAAARERFEGSVAKIDMKLFNTAVEGESKYATEYNKNLEAINKLVTAINTHPLAQQAELDGKSVDKKEYLRGLIADSESEIALVDQEETILGYMAKLVALDAMALSEEVAGLGLDEDGELAEGGSSVTQAVDFFVAE